LLFNKEADKSVCIYPSVYTLTLIHLYKHD